MKTLLFFLSITICINGYSQNTDTKTFNKLESAISKGSLKKVKKIISKGASVDASNKSGVSILLLASGHGQKDIVKFLLEKGADPNIKDEIKRSPLLVASSYSQNEIVTLLKSYGAKGETGDKPADFLCKGWDQLKKGMSYDEIKQHIGSFNSLMSIPNLLKLSRNDLAVKTDHPMGTIIFKNKKLYEWNSNNCPN